MSLRLRFAVLFTISVAILLLISSFTIYYLYYDHRKNEYCNKLRTEAKLTFDEFKDKLLKNVALDNSISQECGDNTLLDKEVNIFSENYDLLYSYLDTTYYTPTHFEFEKIAQQKDYYFTVKGREYIALYFETSRKYVIVSAVDTDGFTKLSKLKYYLWLVSICSLAVSAVVSYFIASTALKPLTKLNTQIQQTTEQNLSQQVFVAKGKDEVSKIAINFNGLIARLVKAFDIQKNFIHHASHELRTPLATMYATTEAALKKNLSAEEYKDVLTSLNQEQNSLIELTNSLLLLFQFEKLQFKPNFQTLRIDEIIYDAISLGQKNFPGINIDFVFDNIEEEDSLIIKGNEVLLKSAFNNLIKNAFLYASDNKLSIALSSEDKKIKIKFSNFGMPLSASVIENIKQPFSSGDNIGIRGVGLGLSIVDRIINLHKGTFNYLACTNNLNTFIVVL